jgi:dTDP-4-amino-4,6-dideoxygalactose transaminase
VHSGTVGLFLALRACGVGPADEVITVGNSDISTTAAISNCGARPVLCDVLETDYTIDPARVEPLITERTVAILPVDLYGHPADVKSLRQIADQHGLKIIEDAALATGACDYGYPVGAFADVTVFSFATFKPLGCVGNGGMLTTNDEQLARRIRLLCGYGHTPDRQADTPGHQMHVAEGYNMPLDPLQAALLTVKLPHLKEWTEKRRAIAMAYAEGLQDSGAILPGFRPESLPTFRSYTIRVKDQQAVYQAMRRAGVEVVLHYVPPIYRQPVYSDKLIGADRLPVTDQLGREIISLPVTVELDEDDIRFVVNTLRDIL